MFRCVLNSRKGSSMAAGCAVSEMDWWSPYLCDIVHYGVEEYASTYTASRLFHQKIQGSRFGRTMFFSSRLIAPSPCLLGVKEVEVQTVCFYGCRTAPKNSVAIITVSGISKSILRSRLHILIWKFLSHQRKHAIVLLVIMYFLFGKQSSPSFCTKTVGSFIYRAIPSVKL